MLRPEQVVLGHYSRGTYEQRILLFMREVTEATMADIMGATRTPYTTAWNTVAGLIIKGEVRLAGYKWRESHFVYKATRPKRGARTNPSGSSRITLRSFHGVGETIEDDITAFLQTAPASPLAYIAGATGYSGGEVYKALNWHGLFGRRMPNVERELHNGEYLYYLG